MTQIMCLSQNVIQFPVQGRDLIAKGMKPGVDVGRQLAQLRDKWKASGYKLSKDQLLR